MKEKSNKSKNEIISQEGAENLENDLEDLLKDIDTDIAKDIITTPPPQPTDEQEAKLKKELRKLPLGELRERGTNAFKKSYDDIMNTIDDRLQQLTNPEMVISPQMSKDAKNNLRITMGTLNAFSQSNPYIKEYIERKMKDVGIPAKKIELFLKIPYPHAEEFDIQQGMRLVKQAERLTPSAGLNLAMIQNFRLEDLVAKTRYLEQSFEELQRILEKGKEVLALDKEDRKISMSDKLQMYQDHKKQCVIAMGTYQAALNNVRAESSLFIEGKKGPLSDEDKITAKSNNDKISTLIENIRKMEDTFLLNKPRPDRKQTQLDTSMPRRP